MPQNEKVLVVDFGGQYNQLVARRVRECNVYCEIVSYRVGLDAIRAQNPKGIIFTGGPNSVYVDGAPTIDPAIFDLGIPVLGLCYGFQLMTHLLGGHVCKAPEREYGKTLVHVDTKSKVFENVSPETICWMSHNDYAESAPTGFTISAYTDNCPVAAIELPEKNLYGFQFHPEVLHTPEGKTMLHNFVYNVCGCKGDWKMGSFVETSVKALREKIGAVDFLAQGTIYPDVVESGLGGESTVIKSHHNVGGLPDYVDFKEIVEPLRDLFKDETRQAGRELGLPEYLVSRQPFPGPGLAIRIIGEVTPDKVKMVQEADAIWREEIAKAGLDKSISQYYAALTNMRSVGVMGDERTYDYAVALRAVTTTDFMTAEAAEIPWGLLQTVTSRIVNEVQHVNRVLYDCTGKPPATIEFE